MHTSLGGVLCEAPQRAGEERDLQEQRDVRGPLPAAPGAPDIAGGGGESRTASFSQHLVPKAE